MTKHENGSVLIEAMVAAAIVSLMLVAFYRTMADSVAHERSLGQKRTALLIAQSELDTVGSVLPLSPGVTSGVDGDFIWRVDIAPYSTSQGAGSAGSLWSVTVSVRANGSGPNLVTLRSLAVGQAS